jgi:L-serine/L-threonine ammonia-lyase
MLVELACSTALSLGYNPEILDTLAPRPPGKERTVVIIVDGGFKIAMTDVMEYEGILGEIGNIRDAWSILP